MFALFGDLALEANMVISNTAHHGGGLAWVEGSGILTNNVIVDNLAHLAGGGLLAESSSLRMLHTTIAHNRRGGEDSGVYARAGSTVALTNTILVSNAVGAYATADSTMTLEATLWGTGTWANLSDWDGAGAIITGTINLWGDPDFVNPDGRDYHISSDSAAIDGGLDVGVDDDIDGHPRPMGDGYDIGADEFFDLPNRLYLPLALRHYP